jgi:Zn-dependent M28 family amino/carboxypeptidase
MKKLIVWIKGLKPIVRITAMITCLLVMACLAIIAVNKLHARKEHQYFYNQMKTLVYDIGNRNNAVEGQEEALNYLIGAYQDLGYTFDNGTLQLCDVIDTTTWSFDIDSSNVIGIRKALGDDPNIIIVCAHFDSIGPGARDNASGVAAVLTLLRRVSQKKPYENTELRFVAFTAEETGHQGSETYVQKLAQDERDRIVAVFNIDIIVVDYEDDDFCLSCDTLGGRTAEGYAEGNDGVPVNNCVSRAFLQAIADLQAFSREDDGMAYAVRHQESSDHDSFHAVEIDAANISFRGNVNTNGSWASVMHTLNDLIGNFDWDRTWQALDILYAAIDGLAQDISYGQGAE